MPPTTRLGAGGIDWGFIWRRKSWVFASVAAALVAGLAFHSAASPRFRAATQILFSPVELRVLDKALTQPMQTADSHVIQVESEVRILTSDKVLRRVVERERLTDDPEFGGRGNSWFAAMLASLRSATGLDSPAQSGDTELAALRFLQRNVSAKRAERTFVVDLTVDTTAPEKSARIANAIAQAYLEEQSSARSDTARRITEALSSRLT
jgi:polysaccharide biosynthesis transport protein